jgi:LysR family glycine cleavage system transcriptional activator
VHIAPLMREIVAPVCSPAFMAENKIASQLDLLKLPLLELVSRPDDWNKWFASAGIKGTKRESLRFEQFMNVSQACIAGLGIALVPLFLIQPELDSGKLIECIGPRIESGNLYSLTYPSSKPISTSLQHFIDWLKNETSQFETEHRKPGFSLSLQIR